MKEIAGVRLPDSMLCEAARQFAERVSSPFLFHHVLRSSVYAEWLGQLRGGHHDPETLFVATILHDLGLTPVAPVRERFEIEGADAAKEFLAQHGLADRAIDLIWDAIALHTTAQIPLRKAPEVALCHLGVACDIRGFPDGTDGNALIERVLALYPKSDLREGLLETLVGLYRKNPAAAASHAVADACERLVPDFRRFNLCDALLAGTAPPRV